jgi:hypothetical protein
MPGVSQKPVSTLESPSCDGVLPPSLRRDLADINRQYLDLGLDPGLQDDPRFGWSPAVRRCLAGIDPSSRARIAASPFAFFDLILPASLPDPALDRVEDGDRGLQHDVLPGRLASFAHQVAFLARQLVITSPLASELVLGLSACAQSLLAEARPSEVAELALRPGLICPRWPAHERFWSVLSHAARDGSPVALQWAHCLGLCLFGASDFASPATRPRARRQLRR